MNKWLVNFEWYRRWKGGRWYYVRLRLGMDCVYYWTRECPESGRYLDKAENWG